MLLFAAQLRADLDHRRQSQRARQGGDRLSRPVDADGLDPADYPVPNFASVTDPAALAEAEIRLDDVGRSPTPIMRRSGRVHWSRVSADISLRLKPPDAGRRSRPAEANDAKDVGEALAGYEPQAPNYIALKAKLAEMRAGKGDAGKTARSPNGPALKVGMQDDRVPQLRERLGLAGGDGTTYDKALAEAVKKFQQEHELKATGTLDAADRRRAQRPPARPADRHHPRQHGALALDAARSRQDLCDRQSRPTSRCASFTTAGRCGRRRIVDGKPTMPTPIMSAEMKYITVNPTWNVPPSIVNNEYLPALRAGSRRCWRGWGLTVATTRDGSVHISQPPGEHNALGRLRFNFPNKFLVYQHDTPDKNLFALDRRAFSHGCMRVAGSGEIRRGAASHRAPGRGLYRGAHPQDVRHRREGHPVSDLHPGAPDLSDRLRRRRRQAANSAKTCTAATERCWTIMKGDERKRRGYPGRAQAEPDSPPGSGVARPAVTVG